MTKNMFSTDQNIFLIDFEMWNGFKVLKILATVIRSSLQLYPIIASRPASAVGPSSVSENYIPI